MKVARFILEFVAFVALLFLLQDGYDLKTKLNNVSTVYELDMVNLGMTHECGVAQNKMPAGDAQFQCVDRVRQRALKRIEEAKK